MRAHVQVFRKHTPRTIAVSSQFLTALTAQFCLVEYGALLEKPPVVYLLKNLPYETRRFITVFTRSLHWSLS
jgi:hypothetical protein